MITEFLLSAFLAMAPQQAPGPLAKQAEQALRRAASHRETGDFDAAESVGREALQLFRSTDDARGQVRALLELATTYASRGDHAGVSVAYRQAIDLLPDGSEGKAHLLNGLGMELLRLAQIDTAETAFTAALAEARRSGETAGEEAALQGLALLGRVAALEIDLEVVALNTVNLAGAHLEQGDTREARRLAEKAVALTAEHELPIVAAMALPIALAAAEIDEDWQEVREIASELQRVARQVGDGQAEVMALSSQARAAHELDRLTEALETFEAVEDRAGELQIWHWALSAAMNRGAVWMELGKVAAACESFEGALDLARKLPETDAPPAEARALLGIASARLFLGDATAEREFEELLSLARRLADPDLEASAHWSLGVLAYGRGSHREAVAHFEAALRFYGASVHPNFAAVHRELAQLARQGLAQSKATLGDVEGAFAEIERFAPAEPASPMAKALTLEARGFVHWRAGRLAEAEELLTAAVAAWEEMRSDLRGPELHRIALLDLQSPTYDLLQRVQVDRGEVAGALETAELGRARSLHERLSGEPGRPPSFGEIQELANAEAATFVVYSLLYDPLRVQVPDRHRGNQPLLEDELIVWLIRPGRPPEVRRVDLANRRRSGLAPLASLILAARETIRREAHATRHVAPSAAEPAREAAAAALAELHELLVEPALDLLPEDPLSPVVLAAHGPLFDVPFAALLDGQGRALVGRHTLLVTPSLAVFSVPPSTGTAGGALVVGDPLGDLPGAREEAVQVARRLGGDALLGGDATGETVRARLAGALWIHVASHGTRGGPTTDPAMTGALQLAPAGGDDDHLTAQEIAENPYLAPNLAVLSACDSGLGHVTAEGVLGLSRSFLAVGAAAVVVSLWRIPDASTGRLMDDFYRLLGATAGRPLPVVSSIDVARALRSAMLAAIERGEERSAWAAFQVVGRRPRYRGDPKPSTTTMSLSMRSSWAR